MTKYRVTVYQDKRTGLWIVEIDIGGHATGISYFETQQEAIEYADQKRALTWQS